MPTLVQYGTGYDTTSSGSFTVGFSSPTTPGNLVVLCVLDDNFTGPYTISDDQGNSYNSDDDDVSQDYEMAVFSLLVANGVTTISVTGSSPGPSIPMQAVTMEWSGIYDGGLDQVSSVNSTISSNWASNEITTSETDLLIGFAGQMASSALFVPTSSNITSNGLWTDVIPNGYQNTGSFGLRTTFNWATTIFVQYIASSGLTTIGASGITDDTSDFLDSLITSYVIGSAPPSGVPQMFDYQIQIT